MGNLEAFLRGSPRPQQIEGDQHFSSNIYILLILLF